MGNVASLTLGSSTYKVVKTLGKGTYGKAFLIEDSKGGKHTMKIFDPQFYKASETEIKNLLDIKQLLGGCQANLQCLEGVYEIDRYNKGYRDVWEELYLPMDMFGVELKATVSRYVDGNNLREGILNKHYESIPMGYLLLSKMLPTLELLHKKNIVHRDIKPENIVYSPHNRDLTLIDFGLACINSCEQIIGTYGYIHPQLLHDQSLTMYKISDLFALGVVLYEVLTGQDPFVLDSNGLAILDTYRGLDSNQYLDEMLDLLLFRPELGAEYIRNRWDQLLDTMSWSIVN